jgi:predicted nucleic acid-binding protein
VTFLLDTDVVAELRKPAADSHITAWVASVDGTALRVSVLVVGETRQGIERLVRRDAAQAAVYDSWLHRLERDFADRIIGVSSAVAEEWERLNIPDPLPVIDGLMAATAKVHGLVFVTRDTGAVDRTGVRLLNPFAPA